MRLPPCPSDLLSPSLSLLSPHPSHVGLLAHPETGPTHPCLRAFAQAIPAARNMAPPTFPLVGDFSTCRLYLKSPSSSDRPALIIEYKTAPALQFIPLYHCIHWACRLQGFSYLFIVHLLPLKCQVSDSRDLSFFPPTVASPVPGWGNGKTLNDIC